MTVLKYYKKKLYKSNLGLSGMHDHYWTVPTSIDPDTFYTKMTQGQDRVVHVHLDKTTNKKYNLTTAREKNKEYRIYNANNYFDDKGADLFDEIIVEKVEVDEKIQFLIDIIKHGSNPKDNEKKGKQYRLKNVKSFDPKSKGYRSGQSRKAEDLVAKAEIYKVFFSVEGNQYIYVGQDSHCAGIESYFGSSLVMWHYENIFGKNIFNKEIVETVENIKQSDLNKLERTHIDFVIHEANQNNWHSLNYTGRGRIFT